MLQSVGYKILLGFAVLVVGCTSGKVDCASSPLITYNNFGRAFMEKECQACHGSLVLGEARQGAPAEFKYDTPEDAWKDADLILVTSTGNEPIMPPSDGVFADDRLRLEIWLRCGQDGAIDGIQPEETP